MIVPILLIGLSLILAYIGSRKQLSKTQLLFVVLFFAMGVVSVLFQPLTIRAAAYLNVGRGADLLLYFSVLCGVLIAANYYFRFKETERILTEIVRRIAIQSPRHPTGEPSRE
jgi:small membrane protein